jgi:hypothetical protein
MAATTKKSGAAKKAAPKKTSAAQNKAVPVEQEKMVVEEAVKPAAEEKVVLKPSAIDPSQYVTVKNGFQGKLIYQSKKTGEWFIWEQFGDEQEMELSELKNAKNSSKKFFINNWFMFDEPWIVDYLGLNQYYQYTVSVNGFDEIFSLSPEEIEETVSKLSRGQKQSVAYRARQLIADGEIDSHKAITALERSLGVELLDR